MSFFEGIGLSFRQALATIVALLISFTSSLGIPASILGLDYLEYSLNREEFDISEIEIEDNELKVMSFNIRCITSSDQGERSWYNRANLVIKNIESFAPDLISFQEVRKGQQDFLKKTLKGYNSVIEYRDNSSSTEGCPVYYRADKYDLLEDGTFWLSETPDVMSIDWGADCYRICTYTILKEKATGEEFVVFSTHFDHVSQLAREKSIELINDKIAAFDNIPAILMGDLNATDTSATYTKARESFLDAKIEAEDTMDSATYQRWGERLDASRIDYILISEDDFDVSRYFVMTTTYDGVYPSDHFPVCAVMEFK